ncbi:MAG: aminodeoxychorismate lyase [Acidiferrobacteraceae bacterium]|nr:aminodeoxychorismate lyase [Acidiferrobacteraceae bacterium]|tara:strand:+ start:1245 stop:2243 length:999 start_codon:yes stop_codon:yes gene_type:complete
MRPLKITVTIALPITFLGFILLLWYVHTNITRELAPGDLPFNIEKGSNLGDFSQSLISRNVIKQEWPLLLWATATGKATRIQAGEYQFPQTTNLRSMLAQVIDGKVINYSITIIEGWTFSQIQDMLLKSEHLTDDISNLSELELLKAIGSKSSNLEGLFFPDTYYSSLGHSSLEILKLAHDTMAGHLGIVWQQKTSESVVTTPYEALILASIIEKESLIDAERTLVSGVLSNRLRENLLLQTDPTIIYGLGDRFDGILRKSDLTTDGPYNTYTRKGLPPTPIANPGMKSLIAAVRPARTSKMFFVARGDGTHEFSDTLEEHNIAVNKYQRKN